MVETKEYSLPFIKYQKTVKTDTTTGETKIERRFVKKSYDDIMTDAMIVTTSTVGINLICNGLAHLINSFKRKK